MLNSNNAFHILPECYIDERLCQILLQIVKVNHKKGFGEVGKEFRTKEENAHGHVGRFWDKPALALVDKDKIKGKSDFFRDGKNFKPIKQLTNLSLQQRKNKKDHYCIIVEPVMEKFLMALAAEAGITATDFSFLADINAFTSESKSKDIKHNADFKRFVNKLIENKSETILTLQDWLQQFYTNLKIEV